MDAAGEQLAEIQGDFLGAAQMDLPDDKVAAPRKTA